MTVAVYLYIATDPARFEGNGISYRAKIIGIEDVSEARGDKMCQETLQKLKGAMKASGQHKQRVSINVTLEGLKIIDGTAMVSEQFLLGCHIDFRLGGVLMGSPY